jgi:hypothetical protein
MGPLLSKNESQLSPCAVGIIFVELQPRHTPIQCQRLHTPILHTPPYSNTMSTPPCLRGVIIAESLFNVSSTERPITTSIGRFYASIRFAIDNETSLDDSLICTTALVSYKRLVMTMLRKTVSLNTLCDLRSKHLNTRTSSTNILLSILVISLNLFPRLECCDNENAIHGDFERQVNVHIEIDIYRTELQLDGG